MEPSHHFRGPFTWAGDVDYSQAVIANGLIFVSGQYGSDQEGNVVSGDFRAQARQTFLNLQSVLTHAGADLQSIVQLRCFLLRSEDFPIYKEVRREFLAPPFPTSTLIYAPAFAFPGMLIEIEVTAQLRD